MKFLTSFAMLLCLFFGSLNAVSGTIRYALIVGNNTGVDNDGTRPFKALAHAEKEAALLKNALVEFSNFDTSNLRTRLLVGASRRDVQTAIRALVNQRKQDEKTFGRFDTLFLFYFTGHGLDGRLLFSDGALNADEVGSIFSEFNADFSVGVFDACYAGGLDDAALDSKGIHSAPGLNLFRELPEEVLSAEGRIWYVSSGRAQESYEDKKIGGVFTHFFIRALKEAQADGPGITLDSIWRYTQSHTMEFTAQRKRIQVPEQFINKLRSSTPVYFSFPTARSATLVLSESLEGRFALAYADGNLTEVFEKKKGSATKLAVYPGNARVMLIVHQKAALSRSVQLNPGSTLHLSTMQESAPSPSVGERSQLLFEKGIGLEKNVSATKIEPGISLLGGIGYSFDIADELLLYARHGLFVPLRLDVSRVVVALNVQYGYDRREFPTWSHTVHEAGGRLSAGFAFDIRRFRFVTAAAFQLAYLIQKYDNGEQRSGFQYHPAVELSVLFPGTGRVEGELFTDVGPISSPGVGENSENIRQVQASIGISLYFRLY